jgi:hypothetical protein
MQYRRSMLRFSMGLAAIAGPDLGAGTVAFAQDRRAGITGRVVSAADDVPIPGVRIVLLTQRRSVVTDSVGRFRFEGLRPGAYQVEALILGHAPLSALLRLDEGEIKQVEFRTDGEGQFLPTIFVDGESQPEMIREPTRFERRMATGTGRYITRQQILDRNPMHLMDMIRFLPGVRTNCYGMTCQVRLNKDPRNCGPAIFMDGVPTVMAVLETTPPNAVHGIEIYSGPSETPPEINNETARCGGAIAVWTRRGLDP